MSAHFSKYMLNTYMATPSRARNFGFSPKELGRIKRLVAQHQEEFLEAWHGHLGTGG
jgi:hypothetical protein